MCIVQMVQGCQATSGMAIQGLLSSQYLKCIYDIWNALFDTVLSASSLNV